MRRFHLDLKVTVSVDDVIRDQRTLWCHQQQEPYPGGHRYEATFQGAATLEHLRDLPMQVTDRLNASMANSFLNRVYFAFETAESSPLPWEFVLNTVDNVQVTGDTVRIAGECSPFVRQRVVTDNNAL